MLWEARDFSRVRLHKYCYGVIVSYVSNEPMLMRMGVIRMLSVQKVTKQYANTVANQDVTFGSKPEKLEFC